MRFCEAAPRLAGGKVPLIRDGLLWECPVEDGPRDGWGWYEVELTARWLRPVRPWEKEAALTSRPRAVLQLLRAGDGIWDALDPRGKPVRVGLVEDGQPFQNVRAVHDGRRWWYLGPAATARARMEQLQQGRRPNKPSLLAVWHQVPREDPVQRRLAEAIRLSGGELAEWRLHPRGYEVVWTRQGATYHSLVDASLNLIQAGFCLAGTDAQHDLTTLVSLVQEAPRQW